VAKFKESLSALGHFWPSQKPANKWPGRVFVDKFPGARLHCMGERPGDGIHPFGRMTFHGITEGNEYVTMLEAQGAIGGQALKPDRSWTESIAVTANYMLVGPEHFDGGPTVRRLSFSSAAMEHILQLHASPDYRDVRHRRVGRSQYERPILHRQVASYVDLSRKMRFRIFTSRVPATTIEPMSSFIVDFREAVTPKKAMTLLHELRHILALICGNLIDLWDVQFHHEAHHGYTSTDVYFYDLVNKPTGSVGFPVLPLLDFGKDRALFRKMS